MKKYQPVGICFDMARQRQTPTKKINARKALLQAAIKIIRKKGYSATSVDDLCKAAGVTKGAFFHHFDSKEDLGVAAANFWSDGTGGFFATAPYHDHQDPLERILGYIDFRANMLTGPIEEFTCVVGTMVQETFLSSAPIRDACRASITSHAATLEADLKIAFQHYGVKGVDAKSLALHTQAVLQGAFILAKATGEPALAKESAMHLRRYVEFVFNQGPKAN